MRKIYPLGNSDPFNHAIIKGCTDFSHKKIELLNFEKDEGGKGNVLLLMANVQGTLKNYGTTEIS